MSDGTVDNLKKYGFAKHARKVLSPHETLELKQLVDELFQNESIVDRKSANAPVIVNLPGRNPRIDRLLEKMVSHEDVRSILTQVLGRNYKIWQLNARRSEIGDIGLSVHQDSPGETNLAILLSDNLSGCGATAFFPQSHKLPRWANRISWSRVGLAARWLTPLTGELGDIAFFFNRVWHARLKNRSERVRDVILISFFPQGAVYRPYKLEPDRLNSWEGWELRRLLDPGVGTRSLENGRVQVVAQEDDPSSTPYAMLLESSNPDRSVQAAKRLYFKLLFLELVFFPLRLTYRLFRSLWALIQPGTSRP